MNKGYLALGLVLVFGACQDGVESPVKTKTASALSTNDYKGSIVQAMMAGDPEAAMALVEQGSDVNASNKFGDTPLMWSAQNGDHKLLKILLAKGAAVNQTGSYGRTALHWAATMGHTSMCKQLLAAGAILEFSDKNLKTPFRSAVDRAQFETAVWLKSQGAAIDTSDNLGETPLMSAMQQGAMPLVFFLVEQGANLEHRAKNGTSPLSVALASGHGELLRGEEFKRLVPDITARLDEAYKIVVENAQERFDIDFDSLAKRIHVLVNKERAAHGLQQLRYDAALAEVAKGHSEDMARRAYFDHRSPEGKGPKERALAMNYEVVDKRSDGSFKIGIGENIYMSKIYSGSTSSFSGRNKHVRFVWLREEEIAIRAVKGWMDSPGHRANILNETYNRQGFGLGLSNEDDLYITQNFF